MKDEILIGKIQQSEADNLYNRAYALWQDYHGIEEISEILCQPYHDIRELIAKSPHERKCKICGTLFTDPRGTRSYCSKRCANKAYTGKHKAKTKIAPLHVINERARAAGMSYGQYISRGGI